MEINISNKKMVLGGHRRRGETGIPGHPLPQHWEEAGDPGRIPSASPADPEGRDQEGFPGCVHSSRTGRRQRGP